MLDALAKRVISVPRLAHFGRDGSNGANGTPKRVFLVHGDPDAAEAFAGRVREMGMEPHIARHRETVDLA